MPTTSINIDENGEWGRPDALPPLVSAAGAILTSRLVDGKTEYDVDAGTLERLNRELDAQDAARTPTWESIQTTNARGEWVEIHRTLPKHTADQLDVAADEEARHYMLGLGQRVRIRLHDSTNEELATSKECTSPPPTI